VTARSMRPRATASLSILPQIVSDLTAPALVGLEPRPFRAFLRTERVPHALVGRRVVARLEHVLAAIDRLASPEPSPPTTEALDDAEPTADQILARIGRVRGRRA
jgi:hypothetical protein